MSEKGQKRGVYRRVDCLQVLRPTPIYGVATCWVYVIQTFNIKYQFVVAVLVTFEKFVRWPGEAGGPFCKQPIAQ